MAITRSENMRRIRSRDTGPERALRKYLFSQGLRYRTCVKDLPGKPDVVNRKRRIAIFVHGCFWHQHEECGDASKPKSNKSYWEPKLTRNVQRDAENVAALREMGYRVIVVWDCEIAQDVSLAGDRVLHAISQSEQ